jgi:uncharacterized phage protein gp47/JayE
MAGLGPSGFDGKRTEDVRQDMVDDVHASSEFGPEAETGAETPLGQVLDPNADRTGELWELGQALYDAWDLDAAEGVALDNLGGIVGVERQPATASTVVITCGGVAATVIPAGSRARVPGGAIFATDEEAIIGGLFTVDVAATATETGPQEASSGSITEIVDSVPGWVSVSNSADAAIGRPIESDASYRARIKAEQDAGGNSTDQAMASQLVALDAVTAAKVISNRTLETDGNGTPGKSFLTVIWPDTLTTAEEQLVAEVLWNNLPTGIYSHGTDIIATVTDSQGKTETVRFDYATQVQIWWEIDVTTLSTYPSNGDDLVEDAVLAYGQALLVGDDVEPINAARLIVDPTANDYYVPGISHLVIRVGKTVSPTGTVPVTIADTEISVHASARITVTS